MSTMDRIDPHLQTVSNAEPMAQTMTAGVSAGIIAGVIMGVVSMINSAITGQGFGLPLKLIGATLLGTDALISSGQALFAGFIIHVVVSAFFGLIFALVLRPQTTSAAATGVGVAYGIVIWAVMTYLVLPTTNHTMYERVALMPGTWFILHLIFGACLGFLPGLRQSYRHAMKSVE